MVNCLSFQALDVILKFILYSVICESPIYCAPIGCLFHHLHQSWEKFVTVATWQTKMAKVLCNVNSNKNLFSNKRSCPLLTITKDLDLKHFYAVYFLESGTIYRHISYIEKNMIFGTMSFETKHSF